MDLKVPFKNENIENIEAGLASFREIMENINSLSQDIK